MIGPTSAALSLGAGAVGVLAGVCAASAGGGALPVCSSLWETESGTYCVRLMT
jgi:hypothetical protein